MRTAARPKTKEKAWMARMLLKKRIASAAPRPAPADTPRMWGETSGLRNRPWNAAPEMDSPAPTNTPASSRGRRTSNRTDSRVGSQVRSMGSTRDARISMTVAGGICSWPSMSAAVAMTPRSSASSTISLPGAIPTPILLPAACMPGPTCCPGQGRISSGISLPGASGPDRR